MPYIVVLIIMYICNVALAWDDMIGGLSQAEADMYYLKLSGGALTGAVTTTSHISGATSPLRLGNFVNSLYGVTASNSVIVAGKLEIQNDMLTSGVIYGATWLSLGSGSTTYAGFYMTTESMNVYTRPIYAGYILRLAPFSYRTSTWGRSNTQPTVEVCGEANPSVNNTRCGQLYHTGTDSGTGQFAITSLSGPVAIVSAGILLSIQSSTPCASAAFPAGSLFLKSGTYELCYCDGSGSAKKVSGGTACY